MDNKKINEEQFRKLVISEAKKIIAEEGEAKASEESTTSTTSTRKITFDKVETLIKEIGDTNKSITSIFSDDSEEASEIIIEESKVNEGPNRDLDVIEHNQKKNVIHQNEVEKDKWNRMLEYKVPSDEER